MASQVVFKNASCPWVLLPYNYAGITSAEKAMPSYADSLLVKLHVLKVGI